MSPALVAPSAAAPAETVSFLAVAKAIAARLARTAVWDGPRCNWVGSAVEPLGGTMQLVQRAGAADVYGGTAGVALFLAELLGRHPDPVLLPTLEGAVQHLLADERLAVGPVNYGYYGGTLGVANTLIDLGERLARPEWEAAGWERLAQVCARPIQDLEVDVVSGVASALPVLLRLLARRPAAYLSEAATRCGDFLLGKAQPQPQAWCWPGPGGQAPMTGYSHGAGGIALALLALYQATSNPAYYRGAMMGFHFERLHFNPQLQNWPDFRAVPGASGAATATPVYGDSWCHGAPGIALSRLRAWQLTGDETFRQEAEIALNTTHRSIYTLLNNPAAPVNFSLCHGLAGNADIMLEGSRVLQNDLYQQVSQAAGSFGIERYHRPGLHWPSGVRDPSGLTPGLAETPGLLLGLAGTGYFYLRLAYPQETASVLIQ